MKKRILFHVGGPAFHPVEAQARAIIDWLGDAYEYDVRDGVDAFERMGDCDLFVLMGLHWTGMTAEKHKMTYRPMQPSHQAALERHVAAGRPILAHHGAIASHDDWPRFGELIGFQWVWGTTLHSPFGRWPVKVLPTGHPVMAGVADYELDDELYYNVRIAGGLRAEVHAEAEFKGERRPMVVTAPHRVYLANGHNLRAFECPALRRLWTNAVGWLLGGGS
jgi:hypothetical protein